MPWRGPDFEEGAVDSERWYRHEHRELKEYGVSVAVDSMSLQLRSGGNLLNQARARVTEALEGKMADMGYPPGSYAMRVDRIETEDFSRITRIYATASVAATRPANYINTRVILNPNIISEPRDEGERTVVEELVGMELTLKVKRNIHLTGG